MSICLTKVKIIADLSAKNCNTINIRDFNKERTRISFGTTLSHKPSN